jgi:uncharacterized protein
VEFRKYISEFDLIPHPEGGFYKEIYRSQDILEQSAIKEFSGERNICTSIYFMLTGNDKSCFHKIKSDEIWHFYKGTTTVLIHCIDQSGKYFNFEVGDFNEKPCFQVVIPKNTWFASELVQKSETDFALCGCTVAPGFDFKDFDLAEREFLINQFPQHDKLIQDFTR